MREIRFRAWDRETKTMQLIGEITWSYEHYRSGGVDSLVPTQLSALMARPYKYPSPLRGIESVPVVYDIDHPDMFIMQYTGLTDKKGIEIYEGDIVDCHHYRLIYSVVPVEDASPTVGVVEYRPGAFVVDNLSLAAFAQIEVIGNIYESPELLEAGDAAKN